MKKKKTYLAVALAVIMVVPMLTGCMKEATPRNLFTDMADSMSNLDSMEGSVGLKMEIVASGQTMSMNLNMDFASDFEKELNHFIGTAIMESPEYHGDQTDLECYQQFDDDAYTMYFRTSDSNDLWECQTGKNSGSGKGGMSGLGNFTQFADDFERKENLSVDGKDCYQLTGEIKGDKIVNLLEGDALQSLSGLDVEGTRDALIPCTICIDKKEIRLVSVSLDLASYMEKAMGNDAEDIRVKTCTLDIQVKKYNDNVNLVIPEEALYADSFGDADENGYEDDYGDDYDYDDDYDEDDGFDDNTGTYEPGTPDKNLSKDWESGQVQINDTIIQLPCTIADIEKSGFQMDTEVTSPDKELAAWDTDRLDLEDANGNRLSVCLYNPFDSEKKLSACQVKEVDVFDDYLSGGGVTVIFPGNVQVGSQKDDVVKAFGKPTDEEEDYCFWYQVGSEGAKSVAVSLDDGKVSSILYSIYEFE